MSGAPYPAGLGRCRVGLSVADGCNPAGLSTEVWEFTESRRFDFGDGVRDVLIEMRLEV